MKCLSFNFKTFILSSFALAIGQIVFGQSASAYYNQYNSVSITSPSAGSLGKYGDIPVSYNTGIPQINIPIYTVTEGTLSLPINLSYHASGLKVMEPASWVGAGWSLNAGGVITRTVQGAPDERSTSAVSSDQQFGYLSDHGFANYLWYQNPDNTQNTPIFLKDIYSGKGDGEPDIFFFNFNGYTGKFYLGDDGFPVVLPQQDLKIKYTYTAGFQKSIATFTITTPDGTQYFFGDKNLALDPIPVESSLSISAKDGYGNDGKSVSSWYLNKIQSADGLFQIKLTYALESYSYWTIALHPVPYSDYNTSSDNGSDLCKVIVTGVRLSQISFSNGAIDFTPVSTGRTDLSGIIRDIVDDANTGIGSYDRARALSAINISNSQGTFCKKFVFSYDYFNDNTAIPGGLFGASGISTDKYRLKLLSVTEQSCETPNPSIVNPPYTFTYFDLNNSSFAPRKLSFAQDHWGFYNGKNNTGSTSSTMIPTFYKDKYTRIDGADRDSYFPEMQYGTLQKITYPTGGYTQFEFQANKAYTKYYQYSQKTPADVTYTLGMGNSNTTNYQSNPLLLNGTGYKITLSLISPSTDDKGSLNIHKIGSSQSAAYCEVDGNPNTTLGTSSEAYFTPEAGATYEFQLGMIGGVLTTGQGLYGNLYEMLTSTYEANDIVGGLRIKTITNNDGINTANNVVTSYSYQQDGTPIKEGILYSRPTYVQVLKNSGPRYTYQTFIANGATEYLDWPTTTGEEPYFTIGIPKAIKSPGSILPMSTFQGNHVGYNKVTVTQTGNGRSEYYFKGSSAYDYRSSDVAIRSINFQNLNPYDTPEYPAPPDDFDFERGELAEEKQYNQNDKLLKDVFYNRHYTDAVVTTPGIRVYTELRSLNSYVSAKTEFSLHSKKLDQLVKTENIYDQSSGTNVQKITTTNYQSLYHNQPTSQVLTANSNNEQLLTNMSYAFDYVPSTCVTINNCWTIYNQTLATNQTLYTQENGTCAANDNNCHMQAFANWLSRNQKARRDYSACSIQKSADFDNCIATAKTNAIGDLKPVLEMRQDFQNPVIETNNWRNSKLVGATYSAFAYPSGVTNFVYPQKGKMITIQSPSTTFTYSSVSNNSLSIDSRYVDETIYKVSNGTTQEITPKSGIITSYLWDYNNNLPVAKAINTSSTEIAYTSFEADGTGNWTVSSTTRFSSNTITGNTYYQLSNGAITKTDLTNGKQYIVSYWTKRASSLNINGTTGTKGRVIIINGYTWTYYQHLITLSGTTITIPSVTGAIDELRLYPANAQMTTYTYEPLVGVSSQCDVNNRITYYEYDGFQRLKLIRDQDKNIIKRFDYQYQQQP